MSCPFRVGALSVPYCVRTVSVSVPCSFYDEALPVPSPCPHPMMSILRWSRVYVVSVSCTCRNYVVCSCRLFSPVPMHRRGTPRSAQTKSISSVSRVCLLARTLKTACRLHSITPSRVYVSHWSARSHPSQKQNTPSQG